MDSIEVGNLYLNVEKVSWFGADQPEKTRPTKLARKGSRLSRSAKEEHIESNLEGQAVRPRLCRRCMLVTKEDLPC